MGVTYLDVESRNRADAGKRDTVTFLVDRGARHSIVPAPVVDSLRHGPIKVAAML